MPDHPASSEHGCSPLNFRAEHSSWSKESTVVRTAFVAPQPVSVTIASAVASVAAIALAFTRSPSSLFSLSRRFQVKVGRRAE